MALNWQHTNLRQVEEGYFHLSYLQGGYSMKSKLYPRRFLETLTLCLTIAFIASGCSSVEGKRSVAGSQDETLLDKQSDAVKLKDLKFIER